MTKDAFSAARTRLGLSQRKIAAKLGMSPTTIGNYEHGRSAIPRHVELAMMALWHKLGDGLYCENL